MVNSDNSQIFDEIMYSIARAYHWKDYSPVVKIVVKVPKTILESYAGKYDFNGEKVMIKLIDNDLYLTYRNVTSKIYFTSDVDFFVYETKTDFKFSVDAQGKPDGIRLPGDQMIHRIK